MSTTGPARTPQPPWGILTTPQPLGHQGYAHRLRSRPPLNLRGSISLKNALYAVDTQAHAAATAQLAEGPQGHPLLMQAMELLEQKEQEARGGTATPTATTAGGGGGGGGSAAAPAAATSVPAAEEEFGERMQQEEGGGEEGGGAAADDAGSLGFLSYGAKQQAKKTKRQGQNERQGRGWATGTGMEVHMYTVLLLGDHPRSIHPTLLTHSLTARTNSHARFARAVRLICTYTDAPDGSGAQNAYSDTQPVAIAIAIAMAY